MISDAEILREQGRVAARQDAIEADIKVIQLKLDMILEFVHQTKGGQKALLWLASGLGVVIGAIGAVVGTVLSYWKPHG